MMEGWVSPLPGTEDTTEFLIAKANLGRRCQQFWSDPVGQYVRLRASEEITDLLHRLLDASPMDTDAQRALRAEINLRVLMLQYLDEAIADGDNAEQQLEIEDG